MAINKVEIYPSKFGKEQMERDILYGPPKEMFVQKKEKKVVDPDREGDGAKLVLNKKA